MAGGGLKSDKRSPGCRFEGMLRRVLDPLAEEAEDRRGAHNRARERDRPRAPRLHRLRANQGLS